MDLLSQMLNEQSSRVSTRRRTVVRETASFTKTQIKSLEKQGGSASWVAQAAEADPDSVKQALQNQYDFEAWKNKPVYKFKGSASDFPIFAPKGADGISGRVGTGNAELESLWFAKPSKGVPTLNKQELLDLISVGAIQWLDRSTGALGSIDHINQQIADFNASNSFGGEKLPLFPAAMVATITVASDIRDDNGVVTRKAGSTRDFLVLEPR